MKAAVGLGMVKWLSQILASLHLTWLAVVWAVLLFLVTFVGSIALVSLVLIKLPADYFQPSRTRDFWAKKHPAIRWIGIVAKNFAGLMLVTLGLIMSVPGVPGQGLLTILLGVMLLDFPGKQQLEYKIVSQPRVLQTINRLRLKFNKPPLTLE